MPVFQPHVARKTPPFTTFSPCTSTHLAHATKKDGSTAGHHRGPLRHGSLALGAGGRHHRRLGGALHRQRRWDEPDRNSDRRRGGWSAHHEASPSRLVHPTGAPRQELAERVARGPASETATREVCSTMSQYIQQLRLRWGKPFSSSVLLGGVQHQDENLKVLRKMSTFDLPTGSIGSRYLLFGSSWRTEFVVGQRTSEERMVLDP